MKRRLFTVILTAVVAIAMLIPASAFAGTTSAPTSSAVGQTSTKWEKNFGTGWSNSPTPPALIGNYIYTGTNGYVYKLNKDTGAQEVKSDYLGGSFGYSMMPIVGDTNNVYVTTYNSGMTRIVKLDANTLKTVWTSDPFAGQNTCPISYIEKEGRLYTGTWGDTNNAGTYFCIGNDGKTVWQFKDAKGYYWAGATEVNDNIVFGSESGKLYSVSKSATGTVTPNSITLDGTVRCTPAVGSIKVSETETDVYAYITTTSGSLNKVKVNTDGTVTQAATDKVSIGASSNSPLISGNYLFVGNNAGVISSYDISKGLTSASQPVWTAKAPGEVKGEMLVAKDTGGNYNIYATTNDSNGGIYYVNVPSSGGKPVEGETYLPYHRQYCISPITAGSDGTMYYKNDSGYIMAVSPSSRPAAVTSLRATSVSYSSVVLNWTGRENATAYDVSYSTNGSSWTKVGSTSGQTYKVKKLTTGKKYYFKVVAQLLGGISSTEASTTGTALPATSKIKTSAGSKKITVSWSTVSGASGYYVYRATSLNGKYKSVKRTTAKSWTNTKLKKHKYYYYKVKAYRTVSKKKITGGWSNISYKKTK